eukprot:Gb_03523 [translate_table: standard]
MTARVTDFGIARLACSNSMHSLSSTLALKGSIGYIAPEYGVGGEVSARGDVYGVLLLEMFTRTRPINERFVGELNLHKWVRSAFPNRVVEVLDNCLFPNMRQVATYWWYLSPAMPCHGILRPLLAGIFWRMLLHDNRAMPLLPLHVGATCDFNPNPYRCQGGGWE